MAPSQGGEGFGGGEAAAAVSDLGNQPGRAQGLGAGQAAEDVRVGVLGELGGDLLVEVLIWVTIVVSEATNARVTSAAAAPAGPIAPGEARLAYVAVTRAQHRLDIGGLAWINDHPDGNPPPRAQAVPGPAVP